MRASIVSLPTRSARSVNAPVPFIVPPVTGSPGPFASGSGSRVVDVFGKEYVDLMAGWGVTCIGHSHPVLVRAISARVAREQASLWAIRALSPEDRASLSLFGRIKAWAHGNRQAYVVRPGDCHACQLCISACPEQALRLAPLRA